MNNILRVQIIYGQNDLQYEPFDLGFRHEHPMLILNIDVEIPLIAVLKQYT